MMKEKIRLFNESLKLVWQSAPGWASANAAISVLRSILPLILVWLLKNTIDTITLASSSQVNGASSIHAIIWPVIALIAVWFLDEAFSDIGNYVKKKQSLKFESFMFGLLHSKASSIDLINFEHPEYYNCLSRASSEATWRPNNILNNLVSITRSLLSLLLMAGLIFTLSWPLAILLLASNIPGVWIRLHYADVLYNFQREQTPEARKSSYFNWLLTGDRPSRELRLFGLGNYFQDLFRKSFTRQKEDELNIIKKRTFTELFSDLFKSAAILVTFLFIASKAITNEITLGEMTMFLVAFRQGMVYIKDFLGSVAGLYEDGLFIGDTFEFLNLKENIKAIEPVSEPGPLKNDIVLEGLSFTYPGNGSEAIKNLDLSIRKGEIIAIAGANGAGKSTLARLLCRLYEADSGLIKYDGTDIRHFDPEKYRKNFSVIFQDFMLYNLSAGENIRLGNSDDEDPADRIMKSASASGIHDLIINLPDGYDTLIGTLFDESRELSWGEWQKIALARALFRDAGVLILDEPSSALDADTEFEIFSRFREIVRGRTSILISHRFSNLSLADRIIVLDKGTIAEAGTHDELLKKKGMYYNMYTRQSLTFTKQDKS